MFSATGKPKVRSAAWRISLWGTLAFACGSMLVFMFLHNFVAHDIQRRSDAWLTGEVETLSEVAERTPQDRLYDRVVGEVAELASHEVPDRIGSGSGQNDSVFFLQTAPDGTARLWAGVGDSVAVVAAIHGLREGVDTPFDLHVDGMPLPFRVVAVPLEGGSHIFLGLSERDELRVLRNLRIRFLLLWLLNVLIGFGIVFFITKRMLGDVQRITEAASRIGESDLSKRVPVTGHPDEVGQLAVTLNRMLERIERSVQQLHTMTNSLAHDLRSPLTAIRAKLELSLTAGVKSSEAEPIVAAIDEVDRLTEILTKSLDVAEAKADALRLSREAVDLDAVLRTMVELYEPSFTDSGLHVELKSPGVVEVFMDASLLHRMLANLFDNELKHLPPSSTVKLSLEQGEVAALLVMEDDGPGFAEDVRERLFTSRVKGENSTGRGLGLAFVEAVVTSHGGAIEASNGDEYGARLTIWLPLAAAMQMVG